MDENDRQRELRLAERAQREGWFYMPSRPEGLVSSVLELKIFAWCCQVEVKFDWTDTAWEVFQKLEAADPESAQDFLRYNSFNRDMIKNDLGRKILNENKAKEMAA